MKKKYMFSKTKKYKKIKTKQIATIHRERQNKTIKTYDRIKRCDNGYS